jgi:hypothetical protein
MNMSINDTEEVLHHIRIKVHKSNLPQAEGAYYPARTARLTTGSRICLSHNYFRTMPAVSRLMRQPCRLSHKP